jgi:hypothetical protein
MLQMMNSSRRDSPLLPQPLSLSLRRRRPLLQPLLRDGLLQRKSLVASAKKKIMKKGKKKH